MHLYQPGLLGSLVCAFPQPARYRHVEEPLNSWAHRTWLCCSARSVQHGGKIRISRAHLNVWQIEFTNLSFSLLTGIYCRNSCSFSPLISISFSQINSKPLAGCYFRSKTMNDSAMICIQLEQFRINVTRILLLAPVAFWRHTATSGRKRWEMWG